MGKKTLACEVEGVEPRHRPKNTWKEVLDSDLKCLQLRASDALNHKNGGNR